MASSPDGAIDLNTIPSSLIGSVEIITGGASATYGSDAVAGVVNFKLRNRIDGLELTAKKSITDEGDGATTSLAAAWGSRFADDRGRVLFALEFADRDTVAGRDRPFFANIRQLAANLYGDHVFAFQLTSVLLIVAVAGTVLLTRRWPRDAEQSESSDA